MRILSVAILAALFAIVSSGGAAWAEDYRGVDVHVTNRGIESVAEMRLYVYKCNHFSEQVHIPQGEDAEVHIAVCPAVAGEMVLVIVEGFIEYADRWAGFTGSRDRRRWASRSTKFPAGNCACAAPNSAWAARTTSRLRTRTRARRRRGRLRSTAVRGITNFVSNFRKSNENK